MINKSALESYREIFGEEYQEFAIELIDTFIESSPKLINELQFALQENDSTMFRRAAHSLKSNGKTFGAKLFADLAYDLEQIGNSGNLSGVSGKVDRFVDEYQVVISELKDFKTSLL